VTFIKNHAKTRQRLPVEGISIAHITGLTHHRFFVNSFVDSPFKVNVTATTIEFVLQLTTLFELANTSYLERSTWNTSWKRTYR